MPRAPSASITLTDGLAEVEILPDHGASIARYDFLVGGDRVQVFAPVPFDTGPYAGDLASFNLVPWSNRIGNGGFTFDGRFVALEPNLPGDPLPIHGNGFQLPWVPSHQSGAAATFRLHSEGPAEFRYDAEVAYALADGALTVTLSVANAGERALPFGLGVHPWLPRTPQTELAFKASGVWLEDDRHLPTERLEIADAPSWDYSAGRALPDEWINNAFVGWDGSARITWPERRLALDVTAARTYGTCVVYSPHKDAPFFCFEPVSHPVDVHDAADPESHGLVVLKPGETLGAWSRFAPQRIG